MLVRKGTGKSRCPSSFQREIGTLVLETRAVLQSGKKKKDKKMSLWSNEREKTGNTSVKRCDVLCSRDLHRTAAAKEEGDRTGVGK